MGFELARIVAISVSSVETIICDELNFNKVAHVEF
jgi:hypothetical protein